VTEPQNHNGEKEGGTGTRRVGRANGKASNEWPASWDLENGKKKKRGGKGKKEFGAGNEESKLWSSKMKGRTDEEKGKKEGCGEEGGHVVKANIRPGPSTVNRPRSEGMEEQRTYLTEESADHGVWAEGIRRWGVKKGKVFFREGLVCLGCKKGKIGGGGAGCFFWGKWENKKNVEVGGGATGGLLLTGAKQQPQDGTKNQKFFFFFGHRGQRSGKKL